MILLVQLSALGSGILKFSDLLTKETMPVDVREYSAWDVAGRPDTGPEVVFRE